MRRIVSLVFATAALVACAKKDAPSDSSSVSQAGKADGPRVVQVTARDFAFVAPDTIQSGMTTFRLTNEGTMLHHVILARLDSGKTLNDMMTAMKTPGPPPKWMAIIGGPNAPDPKAESNATLDVAPGNYAMFCMIDGADKIPHFAKGMAKALTVVANSGASAAAPIADDTITLSDYAFTLSKPLSAGSHTFRVVNNAKQLHELELIKFAPGKTMKDLGAWMAKPDGPPPASGIGGITPAEPGKPVYFTADLSAGEYMLMCFLPAPDKKLHFEHGMQLAQSIK